MAKDIQIRAESREQREGNLNIKIVPDPYREPAPMGKRFGIYKQRQRKVSYLL